MKTFYELKCPSCGANLSAEEGREFIFCQYCGTKILVNDENTYTYRHIDDADVKRTDRVIGMNGMALTREIYESCRITPSAREVEQFYNKYVKTLRLKVGDDGVFRIEVTE